VKTQIVPIMSGVLGTIKKELDQSLQLLPGHPSAAGLKKITLMNAADIMCTVYG